ncbi:hypothetical protein FVEG_15970 [Fusarium verticillioides 7600]|uniref:Uncharacterized protein n=1 Tax=Gibberella moniliformis (strain M3125 / FGSC 7600) TaxID=334819 RepID=W7MG69_GIBM7|nr:hypothetical protein FVEG_15970 [Fusarium verticillioides 7600]EWG46530.1 hypothetical protein FVEG_15970 [Fusarium verticillioides 7600]
MVKSFIFVVSTAQTLQHTAHTANDDLDCSAGSHRHLPPLGVIEISQEDTREILGFRVVSGKTTDTMTIEIWHADRWKAALEAVPYLIWAVYQRLKKGNQAAVRAMIIHSHGEEVDFEDICQQCVEHGVLTGGCKRLHHGTCSNCVLNGRRCTL